MDQGARDGLLVELLQDKIKHRRKIIDRLLDRGEFIYNDLNHLKPVSQNSFNETIHQ